MIYVVPVFVHTSVTLFEGGITSGFVIPVDVFVNVEIEIYVLVLFRNTQNEPSLGVPLGNTSVLNPEFVKL
jgi:hypothetical protein